MIPEKIILKKNRCFLIIMYWFYRLYSRPCLASVYFLKLKFNEDFLFFLSNCGTVRTRQISLHQTQYKAKIIRPVVRK